MRTARKVTLTVLLCAAAIAPAAASLSSDLERFEHTTVGELRRLDSDAAGLYEEANGLRDTDPARAAELYQRVHDQVPGFVHATRRLCTALAHSGRRDEALVLCRQVVAQDAS